MKTIFSHETNELPIDCDECEAQVAEYISIAPLYSTQDMALWGLLRRAVGEERERIIDFIKHEAI